MILYVFFILLLQLGVPAAELPNFWSLLPQEAQDLIYNMVFLMEGPAQLIVMASTCKVQSNYRNHFS